MVDNVLASARRPFASAIHHSNWPDSGLTRNTRAPGYRCSVPGLAGFTGTTLCGARSLITCQIISNFRLPIADWCCRYLNSNQLRKRERDDFGLISPYSQIGNRQSAIGDALNLCLTMRQHSEQAIDCQMQQDISDYRDYDRHHQRMPLIRARAGNDSFKRKVEWIRDGDNKLDETGSAAGRHQRQQKPHSQQGIDHIEDVIDNL